MLKSAGEADFRRDAAWVMSSGGSRNRVLDGGPGTPCGGAILREEGAAHYKVYCAVSCVKMAETHHDAVRVVG